MSYRFELQRDWLGGNLPPAVFVMLNPSTADDQVDDPTIRKCVGFATRWGHTGIRVANLYGWRATDPRDLWSAADPVGQMADWWLARHIGHATGTGDLEPGSRLVVAWGVHARPERVARFRQLLSGHEVWCLGITKDGQPRHPLLVPYDTVLEPWPTGSVARSALVEGGTSRTTRRPPERAARSRGGMSMPDRVQQLQERWLG